MKINPQDSRWAKECPCDGCPHKHSDTCSRCIRGKIYESAQNGRTELEIDKDKIIG